MARIIYSVRAYDWIPRYADAGYDTLIESLANSCLDDQDFITQLNAAGSQPALDWPTFIKYYSDRRAAGALQNVSIWSELGDPPMPSPTLRYEAPDGFGQDSYGIWFNTPNTGTHVVNWYKNGGRVISREQDLSTDRYASKAELGVLPGDIVQVAIVDGGTCGWWGRVEVI